MSNRTAVTLRRALPTGRPHRRELEDPRGFQVTKTAEVDTERTSRRSLGEYRRGMTWLVSGQIARTSATNAYATPATTRAMPANSARKNAQWRAVAARPA